MEQMCDIDVIILSWNRTDETIAAIDSALHQEGIRLHLHIVDQGSEPPTSSALRPSSQAGRM